MSVKTLAEFHADLGPPEDPYCVNCHGFGWVKELADGARADMGWLGCPSCGARQRRRDEVLDYNEAWRVRAEEKKIRLR